MIAKTVTVMVGTVAVVVGQSGTGALQRSQKPFQQITQGEAVVTFLTPSDNSLPDGSFYKGFVFTAERGEWVTISLRSLDFDAALPFVTSDRLRSYEVVHFATHGVIDTENPVLSGLALSTVDGTGASRRSCMKTCSAPARCSAEAKRSRTLTADEDNADAMFCEPSCSRSPALAC